VNCAADVILSCQDLREFPGAIGIGYDSVDAALMWYESPPPFEVYQLILGPLRKQRSKPQVPVVFLLVSIEI
jgi:hypothetical protein